MRAQSTLPLRPALAALAVLSFATASGAEEQPEPIAVEPITERHSFTDDVGAQISLTPEGLPEKVIDVDDASNVVVAEITVQPGATFPWHTHPGPVLATVTEGDLIYVYAEDCVERTYPTGTAFVDPGFDNVHTAFNPADSGETVVIATFLGAPDEGALTLPIDEADGAELDDTCGIERPAA